MRSLADHAAFVDRLHDLPIGQHGHGAVDALDGFARICESFTAVGLGRCQRFFRQVEGVHFVPRLDEVRGHAAAHVAEADEGCVDHGNDSLSSLSG